MNKKPLNILVFTLFPLFMFNEAKAQKEGTQSLNIKEVRLKKTKSDGSAAQFMVLGTSGGKQYRAYVAGPVNAKSGVLLVHDFFGLSDAVKQSAEHLAALGYRAVAVDLYKGKSAKTNEDATALMNAKDSNETAQILKAAISYLKTRQRELACIGFSAGGIDAMRAVLIEPGLFKAAVIVYGGSYDQLPSATVATLQTPLLAITGSLDKWAFNAAVNFLTDHPDKSLELYVYPQADHGYAQPLFNKGKNYNPEASRITWKLIEDFFSRHLKHLTEKQ